jgi:hypothetical protein
LGDGYAWGSNTLEVVESTRFPNNRIKVAISVQIGKGGFAVIPNINAIEGVGGSCLLRVNGIAATARIFVVVEITVFFPNKGIEVAISVQIGKGGGAASPNINAIEGVGGSCLLRVNGIAATACILVVIKNTVTFPNKGIEVAICVQIGKGGGAEIPNRNAIEGVGGSCLLRVNGIAATARILVVVENTVIFPNKGIEVAICVQIR